MMTQSSFKTFETQVLWMGSSRTFAASASSTAASSTAAASTAAATAATFILELLVLCPLDFDSRVVALLLHIDAEAASRKSLAIVLLPPLVLGEVMAFRVAMLDPLARVAFARWSTTATTASTAATSLLRLGDAVHASRIALASVLFPPLVLREKLAFRVAMLDLPARVAFARWVAFASAATATAATATATPAAAATTAATAATAALL
jgi:hypothetical protein